MAIDQEGLSYEEQRLKNIKDNEALLLSLGLSATSGSAPAKVFPKPAAPKKAKSTSNSLRKSLSISRKRKSDITATSSTEDGISTPSRDSVISSGSEPRRSARNSGRKVDYVSEGDGSRGYITPTKRPGSALKREGSEDEYSSTDDDDEDGEGRVKLRKAAKLGMRIHDPKTFGHIPGVEVGRWWPTRMECSQDAIHAPTVAGISGNAEMGAFSVALSGGYPDDVDLGTAFTYTGSGGRDLKGTKNNPKNLRTAPQTFDQSFDNPMNAALKKSAETRKPIRVIRGFKLPSIYAPVEGYRYDGLYTVEKAWMASGLTMGVVGGKRRKLLVCRYAFKRIDGQPELAIRPDEPEEGEEGESGGDDIEGK